VHNASPCSCSRDPASRSDYLDLIESNPIVNADAPSVCGTSIDMRRVKVDAYRRHHRSHHTVEGLSCHGPPLRPRYDLRLQPDRRPPITLERSGARLRVVRMDRTSGLHIGSLRIDGQDLRVGIPPARIFVGRTVAAAAPALQWHRRELGADGAVA